MLLTLISALALGAPEVKSEEELPVGPLIAWVQEKDEKFRIRVRSPYETDPKTLNVVEGDSPMDVVARRGPSTLIVVEHGEKRTYYEIDISEKTVEEIEFTETPEKPEDRPVCKDIWPPKNAGTWSLYLDPDDNSRMSRVQAFNFRAHRPRNMVDTGEPVTAKVSGLVAELGREHIVALEGQDNVMYAVASAGLTRKLTELAEGELAILSTTVASPDGSKLAIGALDSSNWTVRRLIIVDTKSGEHLLEREGIKVAPDSKGGQVPVMKIAWVGEQRVRFSETTDKGQQWTQIELNDESVSWTKLYTSAPSSHHRVPPGAGCRAVYVDGGHVRLSEKGSIVLAGSYKDDSCKWSEDGTTAVCRDDQWVWLVDGDVGGAKSFTKAGDVRSFRFLP